MTKGKETFGLLTLAMAFSLAAGAAVISNGAADAGKILRAEASHAAPLSAEIMPTAFPEGSEYKHEKEKHEGWDVLKIAYNPQGGGDEGAYFVEPDTEGKYYIGQYEKYSPDNVTYYDSDNTVSANIILCLNGHTLKLDEPLYITGDVHICDCAKGEGITCDIVVQDGSLELEGVTANSVTVDGGTLIVSGDTTIGSVTLNGDNSIIECGELIEGAKIEIVADENGERKAPYVHTENEDDLNYFHVSDGSDPAAIKIGVTLDFPEDVTYNGENRLNDMRGRVSVKNLSINTDSDADTDSNLSYGVDYTIQVDGETLSGTTEMINAGTYHVRVVLTEGKHYELDEAGSDEADYIISPFTVEVNVSDNSKTYSGEEQEPTITVTGVPGHFSESDYTVSYSKDDEPLGENPKDVGTYGIIINFHEEAAGNYEAPSVIPTFTISPASITVQFSKEPDATYNGQDWLNTLKNGEYISFEGALGEDTIKAADYVLTITAGPDTSSMTKAGTYTVKVSLSASETARNYKLTVEPTHSYEIKKASLTVNGSRSVTYNGKGQAPISLTGAAADASFKENNESNGYTVTYAPKNGEQTEGQKPKGAGSYNVTFALLGDAAINYEKPEAVTFTIEKATITVNFTALSDAVYNGRDRLDDIKNGHVSFVGTFESLSADDYEVTISSSSNGDKNSMTKAGTYTVNVALSDTVTAKNYTLTGETAHAYTIEKASLKVSVSGPVTYNGGEQTPTIAVTGISGALTEGERGDYTVAYSGGQTGENGKPKDAGTYTVTFTLRGDAAINYNAPKTETFTIEKAPLSVEIGLGTEYDGEDHAQDIFDAVKAAIAGNPQHPEEAEYSVTIDGETEKEVKNVKAGGYLVTVTLKDSGETNYRFLGGDKTLTLTYTVYKTTNAWTGESDVTLADWTYGTAAHEPSAPSKFGKATFTYTHENNPMGTYFKEKPTNAGTYYVKSTVAADGGNYDEIEAVVSFTIEKATIKLDSARISVADKTYDGSETVEISSVTFLSAVSGILPADGGVHVVIRSATLESANANDSASVTIVFAIEGDTNNNYQFESGETATVSKTMKVVPATISAAWKEDRTYYTTGAALFGKIEENIRFKKGDDEVTLAYPSDYTVRIGGPSQNGTIAGSYTFTVTLVNTNYRFGDSAREAELSAEVIQTAATVTAGGDISYYGSLDEAWAAAKGKGTATVTLKEAAAASLTVEEGNLLTLDLGGKTLTGDIGISGGALLLKGVSGKVAGTITVSGGAFTWGGGDISEVRLQNGAFITVQEGYDAPEEKIAVQVDVFTDGGTKVLAWTSGDPTPHFKSADGAACYYTKEGESAAYIGKHSLVKDREPSWTEHAGADIYVKCEHAGCEKTASATGRASERKSGETCTRESDTIYTVTITLADLTEGDPVLTEGYATLKGGSVSAETVAAGGKKAAASHDWTYRAGADGKSIEATCTNPLHDDEEDGAKSFTVNFTAPEGATYSGEEQPVGTGGATDAEPFAGGFDITYQYKKSGADAFGPLVGEPKNAGEYRVTVTANVDRGGARNRRHLHL